MDAIFNQLRQNEPLFLNISEQFAKSLTTSITHHYCGHNGVDINEGGDGMIIPSFVELMANCFFWIEDQDKINLITDADKQIFYKYYWTVELYQSLIKDYMMDDIKKMEAS